MVLKHEFMSSDTCFKTRNKSRNMFRVKIRIRRDVFWIYLISFPFFMRHSMFQDQTMKPGGYKEMSSILANQ
jgi:hypothetical protein